VLHRPAMEPRIFANAPAHSLTSSNKKNGD